MGQTLTITTGWIIAGMVVLTVLRRRIRPSQRRQPTPPRHRSQLPIAALHPPARARRPGRLRHRPHHRQQRHARLRHCVWLKDMSFDTGRESNQSVSSRVAACGVDMPDTQRHAPSCRSVGIGRSARTARTNPLWSCHPSGCASSSGDSGSGRIFRREGILSNRHTLKVTQA